ncbi:MAG: vanadium-dependent haloperoxidase [Candidatus Hydrogenedentes bacterium]|nr:vanadium-dependent haloperoxidase [Candidatus Hydrogenedentota bacterium]
MRTKAATYQRDLPIPTHLANGAEEDYPYIANFCKGLPHKANGEVKDAAYLALLAALSGDDLALFEAISLGGDRPLRNPQAGMAFDMEGPDAHHVTMPPAPRIDSAENSAEMCELYWMALARDVHFSDYDSDSTIADACADMSALSDFRGPTESGVINPANIFRGSTPGDLAGPYLSQFLLKKVPYGTLSIAQRQQTVMPGIDYMTDFSSWLAIQNGVNPATGNATDSTRRFIRNGRDLAAYVQIDALYEAYLNACLILLGMGAPFDAGNPYAASTTTDSFGTFGGPHILSLVTEVATRALKAVWFQKWYVHRRLRPEEFGGRVHQHLVGAKNYPIDSEILDSLAVQATFDLYGTYLLPQGYPEGSPLHPAYGAGHATVAGACVTILKAWFDESFVLPDPVVANADGSDLEPYTGPDVLTVGGELNKVAANIASGRNFAGIHWRSDYWEAVKLGEAVALGILRDQRKCYFEDFSGFTLTKFDGTTVTV